LPSFCNSSLNLEIKASRFLFCSIFSSGVNPLVDDALKKESNCLPVSILLGLVTK
jgi:hypothetical protein